MLIIACNPKKKTFSEIKKCNRLRFYEIFLYSFLPGAPRPEKTIESTNKIASMEPCLPNLALSPHYMAFACIGNPGHRTRPTSVRLTVLPRMNSFDPPTILRDA
jgi:hypothetical protein